MNAKAITLFFAFAQTVQISSAWAASPKMNKCYDDMIAMYEGNSARVAKSALIEAVLKTDEDWCDFHIGVGVPDVEESIVNVTK